MTDALVKRMAVALSAAEVYLAEARAILSELDSAHALAPKDLQAQAYSVGARRAEMKNNEALLALPLALDRTAKALNISLEDGDTPAAIVNGHRIAMGPGAAAAWLRRRTPHEPGTSAAFIALCTAFDIRVVWDIGSLYGYFSVLTARLLPNAKIYAFEMNPRSCELLRQTIETNQLPNVEAINKGASDRSAAVKASINRMIMSEDEGSEDIEVIALDDFPIKPGLVKIDVEGYQAKIIPGMMKTLQEHKPLVIAEFDTREVIGRLGSTNAQTFQPLLDMGYVAFWNRAARDADGTFVRVHRFAPRHERNSLMIFAHPDGPAKK